MAIMIPDMPKQFDPASKEGDMFAALEQLSDDYYVFHSFKINTVVDNVVYESETDFVIFNPQKGIICIEAKAGQVRYENGCWLYANGSKMHGDGPFAQAANNKWKLLKYIEQSKASYLKNKCKLLHAVWFPSISSDELRQKTFPADCDKKLILTREALSDPTSFVERIFSIELPSRTETTLTPAEAKDMLNIILCPHFNIFPSSNSEIRIKEIRYNRLLKEQANVLNFLSEQRTAIINGAAGTGKTVIAVQKAHSHANSGDKVLFMCYNRFLKEHLEKQHSHPNIDYYTIDGYCCKLCNLGAPDYYIMKQKLEEIFYSGKSPYDHIIIDEGQDLAIDKIDDEVIEIMQQIILENTEHGTFFIFYDKYQLIQFGATELPKYILDADCKLTLYKNCRNTKKIAETSLSPINGRIPMMNDETYYATSEDTVKVYFEASDAEIRDQIDYIITGIEKQGYTNIVILTTKTEKLSRLFPFVKEAKYGKYPFTTCRKFKGLEADAILLVDVDRKALISDEEFDDDDYGYIENNALLFYTGASRARYHLDIFASLSDEDCTDILEQTFRKTSKIKRPKRELVAELKAFLAVTTL